MKVRQLLQQLANEMNNLFVFMGDGAYEFPKQRGEDFIVDTIACYDLRLKKVFFCEENFLRIIERYKELGEEFSRIFAIYILLHEFTHYVLDHLGIGQDFFGSPMALRFDEPFCEYIAIRACVDGRLRLFNCEWKVMVSEYEKKFTSFISSMPRPAPYCYFREIYARSDNLLGESAETIFLRIKNTFSRIRVLQENPSPTAIFRLLLASNAISPKEIYTYEQKIKKGIKAVGVVNASVSL